MAHSRSSPLIVLRFSRWHLSDASEVMKEMNSETHSCTVSFASFAILAFEGSAYIFEGKKKRKRKSGFVVVVVCLFSFVREFKFFI